MATTPAVPSRPRVLYRYVSANRSDVVEPVCWVANLLDRRSTADSLNQRGVGDTTESAIGESGRTYRAAVIDLYSLFIVG